MKKELFDIIRRTAIIGKDQQKSYRQDGTPQNWILDIKGIILDPLVLNLITGIFLERYKTSYPFQVGCQETAAIPLVSAIVAKSQQIGEPISGFYIRKSRKKDGLQNIIEGKLNNEKIILIDDIINSGQTINRQIKVLEEQKKRVEHVFAIVNFRETENYKFLDEKNIKLT